VRPILTPLAIDPAHPFPQFGNKSLNILLWLDDPDTPVTERMLAFIPVPRILPRVVRIPGGSRSNDSYVFLSDVIKIHARRLFPGYRVLSVHAFRITRNSDLYIDDEEVSNLLKTIEQELYNLRKGSAVRLEVEAGVDDALLDELLGAIRLPRQHVFQVNGPINLMRLMSAYEMIDRPDLKFTKLQPYHPPALRQPAAIFEAMRAGDILLHHPYDSYEPIVDFLRAAAADPAVLAIKISLYRTSTDSPIVRALMDAVRTNTQVTVLIELKARFDEAANINWARAMEEAGIHVVYGFVGLKTHCKCCLVVRREEGGLRRYAHLGSGNYHTSTARLYTDFSLFTVQPELTAEVAEVFNTLTGFAKSPQFRRLMVAPYTLHRRMNALISQEARNARNGLPARIIVKCNSLIDKETIDNLYEASSAGVQIDLIIRGICGLVPGVRGLSDNIKVRSILGRFLEHSRLFYFANSAGKAPLLYAGSADWMARNFYRRIEVVFPIEDPRLRQRVVSEVLEPLLRDNVGARMLRANGSYVPPSRGRGEEPFCAQSWLLERASQLRQQPLPLLLPDTGPQVVAGAALENNSVNADAR
jgi:polyphosphate kinase